MVARIGREEGRVEVDPREGSNIGDQECWPVSASYQYRELSIPLIGGGTAW